MDAEEWGLFYMEGNELAAEALTKELDQLIGQALVLIKKDHINRMLLAKQIRDKMYLIMDKYSDLGARDTEPESFLVSTIESKLDLMPYSLNR